MTSPWVDWDHVVKLDPDKSLAPGDSFGDVCRTGTDAIEIGGTTGMTREKMRRVVEACSTYDVPLYQEPSSPSVVVDDDALDGYLVPTVLNAGQVDWVTGAHKEWVRLADVDWDRTFPEAYVVCNPDSSVAAYTDARCDLGPDDVAAYAEMAERLLGQDLVYVEYSGTLGDPETVAAAGDALEEAALFYGGGVHDFESARLMGRHADTVVVGDLVHEAGADAVRETVDGVRAARQEQLASPGP